MELKLVLGNKNYSSWSMRAWLLLKFVDAQFEEIPISLYRPGAREEVARLGGETGLVPVLIANDWPIWDTLAIAEFLYELFPKVWPEDRNARARARSYCGEVHSGLNALRAAMPVNCRARRRIATRSADVDKEIARVESIWSTLSDNGPWLLGEFCAADIMFAPVATRFQTYEVMLPERSGRYMDRLLRHPLVQEWFRLGEAEPAFIEQFELSSQ